MICNDGQACADRRHRFRQNSNRRRDQPQGKCGVWFNFFLVGFTGLLAVIGAGQCYLIFRTLKATEIAADAAKGALIATARPRIIVRKVEPISRCPPNRSVSAQFAITNVGGSRTVLIEMQFSIHPTGSAGIDSLSMSGVLRAMNIGSKAASRSTPLPTFRSSHGSQRGKYSIRRLAALSLWICEVSRRGRHSQRNGVRTPVRSEGQPLPPFE